MCDYTKRSFKWSVICTINIIERQLVCVCLHKQAATSNGNQRHKKFFKSTTFRHTVFRLFIFFLFCFAPSDFNLRKVCMRTTVQQCHWQWKSPKLNETHAHNSLSEHFVVFFLSLVCRSSSTSLSYSCNKLCTCFCFIRKLLSDWKCQRRNETENGILHHLIIIGINWT